MFSPLFGREEKGGEVFKRSERINKTALRLTCINFTLRPDLAASKLPNSDPT